MVTITAIAVIAVFIVAFRIFGVVRVGSSVLLTFQTALESMRNDNLDDEMREKEVRRASLQLMGAFISIAIRSSLACLASLLPIGLASLTGLANAGDVVDFLSRWDVIAISSTVVVAVYVIWSRRWTSV